ncbi:MAG: hypothetical protein V1806_07290 [Pseudomonadota bacterium]
MSVCRFYYQNLLTDPAQLVLSSARPGMVGMPVAKAQGTAVAYASGLHQGGQDRVFELEIDSLANGEGVGQATFRWRRADVESWEQAGVLTQRQYLELADGVCVKWVSGQEPDFVRGDSWSILAGRNQGAALLLDRDRDTYWQALGCDEESLTLDLGASLAVPALILADHNLSDQAQATLLASDQPQDWQQPPYRQELAITRPHLCALPQASHRYWRLLLADPQNPAGALSASLLYLGDYFQPSRMFAARYGRTWLAGRSTTATDAGKVAGSTRGLAESWRVSFRGLTEGDVARFQAMYQAIHDPLRGRLNPLFFTPFGEDPAGTLYCLPGASLTPVYQHLGSYALELELEEVVRTHV